MVSITSLLERIKTADVKWVTLGDVAELKRGKSITAKSKQDGDIPVISGGRKPAYYNALHNRDGETIAIAGSGAYAGFVSYWNEPIYVGDAFSIQSDIKRLNMRFLYHYLLNRQDDIYKFKSIGGIPHVYPKQIAKLKIPLPSLALQSEIVEVLDKLSALTNALTNALTSENTMRIKQYHYYRDKLLTFNNDMPRVRLGDVVQIKHGKDWKSLQKGNIPVYGSGGIMGYVDTYSYNKPTILIPRKGSITNLFYVENPFWNVDTIYYTIINNDKIIPKFLYYFLKTINLSSLSTNPTRPSLTQAILNEIEIPLPSLQEQEKIVKILDQFDQLSHSITLGLPKAIELHKKRYQYYRDALLNFK